MQEIRSGEKYKVNLSLADKNDVRVIACDFVESGVNLLDVGCACGDFGALLRNFKACNVYGLDYDADSLRLAAATACYDHLEQVDLNVYDINHHPEWNNYFDCITFLDVLEHLLSPLEILRQLLTYLRPGGEVVVSLPNIAFGDIKAGLMNDEFKYAATGILDNTHLRFFTYKSIARFLAEAGLVVSECDFKVSRLDLKLKSELDGELYERIQADMHSFIYQYVLKCKQSERSVEELFVMNLAVIDNSLSNVRPRLLMLGAKELLSTILPPGSKWRRKLKDVVAMIRWGVNK